jgi:CheY-like chemotaxis protein
MNVLLVEDDEIVRAVLTDTLADAGMHVRSVAGPAAALELPPGNRPPTVLLTDVNLGVAMDGFALADAVRQRWPAVRIIVMSGGPQNLNGHQLHPSDRFLAKPFDSAELLGVIRDLAPE